MGSTLTCKQASSVSPGPTKFFAISSVNMSLCVYKDSCFARMFGAPSSSSAAVVPRLSYALFAIRDSMTIFASFNLPPIIAPQLASLPSAITSRFSRILSTESGRANTAQFLAPAAIQMISTPIHLLGLDLYNRQGRLGFAERYPRILRDWGVSALVHIHWWIFSSRCRLLGSDCTRSRLRRGLESGDICLCVSFRSCGAQQTCKEFPVCQSLPAPASKCIALLLLRNIVNVIRRRVVRSRSRLSRITTSVA